MPHLYLHNPSSALRPREKLLQVPHQFREPEVLCEEDDFASMVRDFQPIEPFGAELSRGELERVIGGADEATGGADDACLGGRGGEEVIDSIAEFAGEVEEAEGAVFGHIVELRPWCWGWRGGGRCGGYGAEIGGRGGGGCGVCGRHCGCDVGSHRALCLMDGLLSKC